MPCLTPCEGYSLWANAYDREANPMLTLERRVLEPLLPPIAGSNVVDIGCGTGRWLEILKKSDARSLLGIDLSPEMLNHARTKLGDAAKLMCADFMDTTLARASTDVVLCNFVLSYVEKPRDFLSSVRRILRSGGQLFLTDMHPETANAQHWRRGVRLKEGFKEIRVWNRSLGELIALFEEANLEVQMLLESKFSEKEKEIFEENGKQEYFDKIRDFPAIYVLQATTGNKVLAEKARGCGTATVQQLRGGRFALGARESVRGELHISNSRVERIHSDACRHLTSTLSEDEIDLRGYLVLPGLVNAHDHLEFALFPRLGKGGYKNFLDWVDDIHQAHADEIARQRKVPKRVRLWWGGIRNLLCGVTTVCHHNPYAPEVFSDGFVVRVLKEYGWAHSLSLEPEVLSRKEEAPPGSPFFIHLGEGIDERSGKEIFELKRKGALDSGTVIIHGLGLSAEGSALLLDTGAGLVWCPSSNLFLFGKSVRSEEIRRFQKVALGSDSPLTSDGDLLDEVRCAHGRLKATAAEVYGYVTLQAAKLLELKEGEGILRVGGVADLIAVRDKAATPAETLAEMSFRDVELVLLGGLVQLASAEMRQRLPSSVCEGLQPLLVEGILRWIRAPLEWLFEETVVHLGGEISIGGKHVRLGG